MMTFKRQMGEDQGSIYPHGFVYSGELDSI